MILKPLRPETIRTDMGDYVLSVRDLRVRGSATAFDVDVKRGELAIIRGPGASDALSALAGLVRATGSVRFRGYEVITYGTGRLARSGIVLAGRAEPFVGMSVLDDTMVGAFVRTRSASKARAAALEWLGILGLSELAERTSVSLSAIDARRLSIARALAAKPLLLLLDGAFSAPLPAVTEAMVQAICERGTAILAAEPDGAGA
jgi:ABC-type branched-subunit amino acid transport system ATPase component